MTTAVTTTGTPTGLTLPSASVTPVSLELDEKITKQQYLEVGKKLSLIESASQWWIGDWLNAADPGYGEHEAICRAVGLNYNTARTYAQVCRQIDIRISDLTFRHHQDVAALPAAEQSEWLTIAEDNDWKTGKLRAELRRKRRGEVPNLEGIYRIVFADPPWSYGDTRDGLHGYSAAQDHYPTMTIEELCAMDVKEHVTDDAVLFLWVTSPLLDECWPVIEAWGFEYKTSFVWDKVKHNVGHYNSVRHEFLLICTRGSCIPEGGKLFDSVVQVERSNKHSEKPQEFYDIIETLYPNGNRIELFARKQHQGWAAWGNEVAP